MELPEIRPEERTPLVEALLGIIGQLLDRVRELEESNQLLRDEVAKLKGQKPRPDITGQTKVSGCQEPKNGRYPLDWVTSVDNNGGSTSGTAGLPDVVLNSSTI